MINAFNFYTSLLTLCSLVFFQIQSLPGRTAYGMSPEYVSAASACDFPDKAVSQLADGLVGFLSDDDCDHCIGMSSTQYLADDFTALKSANIVSLCVNGGYYRDNQSSTDDFRITYYHDNAGLPGAILAGPFNLAPVSKILTGSTIINLSNIAEYEYSFNHPPVALTAGSNYWVSVINNTVGNTDTWVWESGNPGAGTGPTGTFVANVDGSGWFATGASSKELSFCIGYANPVPTVGQWGLFLLGLTLLIAGTLSVQLLSRSRNKVLS